MRHGRREVVDLQPLVQELGVARRRRVPEQAVRDRLQRHRPEAVAAGDRCRRQVDAAVLQVGDRAGGVRQVVDVDELEPELLGHLAHRAVGERAGDVADLAQLILGERLDLGQVVVARPHHRRAARCWRAAPPRGSRSPRASGGPAPGAARRGRGASRRSCPCRPDGRQPELGVDRARLRPLELDLEAGALAGRRRRRAAPNRDAERSAIVPSSESRGSRWPFSMRESWLRGDADIGAELFEGESGRGAEVPHPLARGSQDRSRNAPYGKNRRSFDRWGMVVARFWAHSRDTATNSRTRTETPATELGGAMTLTANRSAPPPLSPPPPSRRSTSPSTTLLGPAARGHRPRVVAWVEKMAHLTTPDTVVWVDGSRREQDELLRRWSPTAPSSQLNADHRPYSFLARSHPDDVARVESRTFICSERKRTPAPTNNWPDPAAMRATLEELFAGSMRGRTMYVVPFSMGPLGSPLARLGVQVTDSPYVVVSMGIMTRMGTAALAQIGAGHRVGPRRAHRRRPARTRRGRRAVAVQRHQVHLALPGDPGDLVVRLRLRRQRPARQEGVRAAHRVRHRPRRGLAGRAHAAAQGHQPARARLPRRRGLPERMRQDQLRDAPSRPSPAGRSRPSATTSPGSRPAPTAACARSTPRPASSASPPAPARAPTPTALESLWGNTIFTNVALRDDGDVWWEGMTDKAPDHLIDWPGEHWTPDSGRPPLTRTRGSPWRPPRPRPSRTTGRTPGRRHRRDHLRRPPCHQRASGGGGTGLGARRLHRRDDLVRAHGGRRGHSRGAATRPVRDAPVLRLQHGRPLAALARRRRDPRATGGVPRIFQVNWFRKGDDGTLPVARIRRERPRARLDPRARRRHGRPRSRAPSAGCPRPARSTTPPPEFRMPTGPSSSDRPGRPPRRGRRRRGFFDAFDGRVPAPSPPSSRSSVAGCGPRRPSPAAPRPGMARRLAGGGSFCAGAHRTTGNCASDQAGAQIFWRWMWRSAPSGRAS